MLGFDPDDAPDGLVPLIPSSIPIASRDGIDLDPVDLANPDQLLWLRALIWPEHLECHQQLIDAAAEFEHSDIRMHAGDASRVLPALIETIPLDHAMVVYSTIALYQFPAKAASASPLRSPAPALQGLYGRSHLRGTTRNSPSRATGTVWTRPNCWLMHRRMGGGLNGGRRKHEPNKS